MKFKFLRGIVLLLSVMLFIGGASLTEAATCPGPAISIAAVSPDLVKGVAVDLSQDIVVFPAGSALVDAFVSGSDGWNSAGLNYAVKNGRLTIKGTPNNASEYVITVTGTVDDTLVAASTRVRVVDPAPQPVVTGDLVSSKASDWSYVLYDAPHGMTGVTIATKVLSASVVPSSITVTTNGLEDVDGAVLDKIVVRSTTFPEGRSLVVTGKAAFDLLVLQSSINSISYTINGVDYTQTFNPKLTVDNMHELTGEYVDRDHGCSAFGFCGALMLLPVLRLLRRKRL